MRISKKMLWTTLGSVAVGGVGLVLRTIHHYRQRMWEREFEQQELQVLEGEGGICLN